MNGFRWVCAATAMTAAVGMVSCQDRVSSVCGDYVDARAEQTARCSGFPLDDESKSSFSDLCVAAAAAPGASGYVDGLEACADAIAKAGCGAGGDACKAQGSLPDGAPCAIGAQCTGGECDRSAGMLAPNSDIRCGTCATYLPVGAMCAASGPSCDPYVSRCATETGTCVAYGKEGEACTQTSCDPSLYCDDQSHTCRAFPVEGEPCTIGCRQPFVCENGSCRALAKEGGACAMLAECEPGLDCNAMHVCAQPKRVAKGEACGLMDGALVDCEDGLDCDLQTMRCVPAKTTTKGSPCTPGSFECGELLACVDGTCQVPDYARCGH